MPRTSGRGGSIDAVTGEHKGLLRVRIWKSADLGQTWTDTVVDNGEESHIGTRLVDLKGDCALDIVSIAYDRYPNTHVRRNDAVRVASAASSLNLATPSSVEK